MAKLKNAEQLAEAKKLALAEIQSYIDECEQTDDFKFVRLFELSDGTERWVEISVVAKDKMLDDNGKRVPYEPDNDIADFEFKKEERKNRAEETARKKAETLRKAEERKAKAKQKAELAKKVKEEKLKGKEEG